MINQTPVTDEEALQYDLESLEDSVDKSKQNIQLFRDTIIAEESSIDRLRGMIAVIEPKKSSSKDPKRIQRDIDSMESTIEKSKENIKLFRGTITEEETTVDRTREMIAIIKVKGKK